MKENDLITFAGLLHDIGKFTYRAIDKDDPNDKKQDHETLGGAFIQTEIKPAMAFKDDNDVMTLESYTKRSEPAVFQSDCISASERISEAKKSMKTFRPLESVLSKIDLGISNNENNEKFHYFEPYTQNSKQYEPKQYSVPDNTNWALTSIQEKEIIAKNKESYNDFLKEIRLLRPIRDFRSYYTSFYYVFERYGSRICSAGYASRPDISLFDHSRNVSATALCRKLREGKEEKDCILFTGDFTGIQKFIYDDVLNNSGIAKKLRGKSFFVKLLADAVVAFFLKKLNLFESNILMNSGGHFILIIPKTNKNIEVLAQSQTYLETVLFKKFAGKIQLVFASLECFSEDLHRKDENGKHYFSGLLKKLHTELSKNKKKKSYSILENIIETTTQKLKEEIEREDKKFTSIGGKLPNADYLIEIQSENIKGEKLRPEYFPILNNFGDEDLGIYYLLLSGGELKRTIEYLDELEIDRIIIYSIDKEENKNYVKNYAHLLDKSRHNIAIGFKYLGSFIPRWDDGEPYSFEDLAKNKNTNETYDFLGALRMDVDNLGKIFVKGLGDKDYSISKYSALSREINNFFMDYIPELAKKYYIYLVYAGGDDLFAVGNWEAIIQFAKAVRDNFKVFASNNPNITISGGIVLVKPGFPIARFSQLAGEEESKAKEINEIYQRIFGSEPITNTKDAISLFGRQVKWSTFENMIKIKDIISQLVNANNEKDKMPLSFVHFLLTQTQQVFDKDGNFNINKVHWTTTKMKYMYSRRSNINNDKINDLDNKKIDDELSKYKISLAKCFMGLGKHKDSDTLSKWYYNFRIPASYIIYKNRRKK